MKGADAMNEANGNLLEEEIKHIFKEAGWDIRAAQTPHGSFCPDFEIFSENRLYGYVEVYNAANPEVLVAKINKIKRWLEGLGQMPLLLILTDGFEFHISEYGEPFEMYHYVPSPTSYPVLVSLIKDYVASISGQDGEK